MTEPTPAILAYTHPPPPRQNRLAGADPHWLRTLARGCLILTLASFATGLLQAYWPISYFSNTLLPLLPLTVYLACNVLFSFGAMLAVFPSPPSNALAVDDDPLATTRTLVWLGQGIVLANDLIQILADHPTIAHPSATLQAGAHYAAMVAGLVAALALTRHLRHRARELSDDGVAARLNVVFLTYLIGRGFTAAAALAKTPMQPLRTLRQNIVRVDTAAHICAAIALIFLALCCWSLSAAFRQTADGRAPTNTP